MMDRTHNSNHIENNDIKSCTKVTYQTASVSVPVTVKPDVNTGIATTFCCGEPKIIPYSCTLKTCGKTNGSCSYIVSQNISIEVPIEFSARACVGDPIIECGEASCIDTSKEIGKKIL